MHDESQSGQRSGWDGQPNLPANLCGAFSRSFIVKIGGEVAVLIQPHVGNPALS
jgi:hypothetical protein